MADGKKGPPFSSGLPPKKEATDKADGHEVQSPRGGEGLAALNIRDVQGNLFGDAPGKQT